MSDLIGNLPTDEQIEALAELAAHPRYRALAQELREKNGDALTEAVLEYARPDWFKAQGLPLPDGAKVNPRIFESPQNILPVGDLNKLAKMVPTVDDPKNPLNPLINPGFPNIPKSPFIPKAVPGGISPDDPRALTICGSLGAGVVVTGCVSVGT